MTFLNAAGLFLLLFIPVVLLFHLLRARRRILQVSTQQFWNPKSEKQGHAHIFSARLLLSPSLLMQLFAVLMLACAFAQPTINIVDRGWPRAILVIDNSASMSATDGQSSRLDTAKRGAVDFVRSLGAGQEGMVILTGSAPKIALPFTSDGSKLKQAIENIAPTAEVDNIGAALQLAKAIGRGGPDATIQVFSDNAPYLDESGQSVAWHQIGKDAENVGITAFSLRRVPNSDDEFQALITLANFGSAERRVPLDLSIDQEKIFSERATLPASAKRSYIVPFRSKTDSVVTAQIDPHDALAIDDVAQAVLSEQHNRIKVVLVTSGNRPLEQALLSDPRVDLELAGIDELENATADVIVFDRHFPAKLPPGNHLLIGDPPEWAPLRHGGVAQSASVIDWDRDHPVLKGLDLSGVETGEVMIVEPEAHCTRLIESKQTPLSMACSDGRTRTILLGFDLTQSNLPSRAIFPVLMSNFVEWLREPLAPSLPSQLKAGQPLRMAFGPDPDGPQGSLQVDRPDGRIDELLATQDPFTYYATDLAGVYTVSSGDQKWKTGVNLLDENESNLTFDQTESPADSRREQAPTYEYRRPLWPLLAVLALVVLTIELIFYVRRSGSEASRGAMVLRAVVLLLIGFALFRPTQVLPSKTVSVAALIDVSESVQPGARAAVTDALQAAADVPGKRLEVMTFAGSPRRLDVDATGAHGQQSSPERSKTDIADAIRFAIASLPVNGTRHILIATDGNETTGSALQAAWQARQQQVRIYPLPIGGLWDDEVYVDGILVPDEVKIGEPFEIGVRIWSGEKADGHLTVNRNGEPIISEDVLLNKGPNFFTYKWLSRHEGIETYAVRIAAAADTLEENNSDTAAVAVRGRPRILIVDAEPGSVQSFVGALRSQDYFVDSVTPGVLNKSVDRLGAYDSVILSNVSASALSEEAMKGLERYVLDDGGGLIMLGGDKSFGAGGYFGTPIERILPVNMQPRARVDVPSQAIILVIDRSGSMSTEQGPISRIDMAKLGAQQAIDVVSSKSEVGVLAFDTEAEWVTPLQPILDKKSIADRIATIETGGGGTELLTAITEAYKALAYHPAMIRHVIVLSDGEAPVKDFEDLLEQMTEDDITLSSIAIGSEAGRELLETISVWGRGRYYYTNDLSEIPRIFATEMNLASNSTIREGPFQPSIDDGRHEILSGISWDGMPSLHGYVSTTIKPSADVLLTSPLQDPVLAVWRNGLGRAVAFTSDVRGRWGKDWLDWEPFNKLFGQLVRWTLRDGTQAVAPHVSVVEGHGTITANVTQSDGTFVNLLEGNAGIVHPGGSREVVALSQFAPGQYAARFPADAAGVYLAGLSLHGLDGQTIESLATGTLSYPREYRLRPVNQKLLASVAALTGGEVIADPEAVFAATNTAWDEVKIWPWLLLAALLALIGDLFLRWTKTVLKAWRQAQGSGGRSVREALQIETRH